MLKRILFNLMHQEFKAESIALAIFSILFLFGTPCLFAQTISINLVAVNGTEEVRDTPLQYYLPRELRPEDILDIGSLVLDYDEQKNQYFVFGSFLLNPKESKTIRLTVNDVWRVDLQEIAVLKEQIDQNLAGLTGTEFYESAKILREALMQRLDYILSRQDTFGDDVGRRIEEYRANNDMLRELKASAFSSEYLTSYPLEPELEDQTVRLILEVENPSQEESRKVTQKHYLPKEIRARHIIDSQDFDIRFDADKQQAYLTKDEEFQPGEKKRYVVLLRNAWHIPKPTIDALRARTEKALNAVLDEPDSTSISPDTARFLAEKIFENINEIIRSQSEVEGIEHGIGVFRINKRLFEESEQYLRQLERILALVSIEKLKRLESLQQTQVTNVLQRIQALRGISALSTALFGKRISVTMTWRIIWGILAFVAFFTSIHFFTWRGRSKYMGEENAQETKGEIKEITPPEEEEEKKGT